MGSFSIGEKKEVIVKPKDNTKSKDNTTVTTQTNSTSNAQNSVQTSNEATQKTELGNMLNGSGNSNVTVNIKFELPEELIPKKDDTKEKGKQIVDEAGPTEPTPTPEKGKGNELTYIPKEIVDHALRRGPGSVGISDKESLYDRINPNRKTLDNLADDVRKDIKLQTNRGKFITNTFEMLDKNGDGKVLYSELQEAYQNTADVIENTYPKKYNYRGETFTPADMNENIAIEVNDDIMQYADAQNGADSNREINMTEWGLYLERNYIYENDFLKPIDEM